MSDRNLSSIPLPSTQSGSDNGGKKSAKEMLQRALEDHSKGSSVPPDQELHSDSAPTNIVDMLFKDFISKTSGKASVPPMNDSSVKSDVTKLALPVGKSSVSEINQILDMEIKSLTSGSQPMTNSTNSQKTDSSSKSSKSNTKNKELSKSLPLPIVSSVETKLSNVNDNKDQTEKKSSFGNQSEIKKDESRVPQPAMLPLPLAKKAMVKTKMLDLKLSKESLSLIKEKTPVSGEEGEVFSSNSDESDKNDSDSDSEGLASEGGSTGSGIMDDKKAKKHKKKHRHKKKKKKKKNKNKDKDKDKDKERSRSESIKPDGKETRAADCGDSQTNPTSSLMITRTVFNKSAYYRDRDKDDKESRKRKTSEEDNNHGLEIKVLKNESSREVDEKNKRKDKKKHKKSRSKSRSKSPKRSRHSSRSRSKSPSRKSRRNRSESPKRRKKSKSKSPGRSKRLKSPKHYKRSRSRSRSPRKGKRSRSRSPRRTKSRSRSRSPRSTRDRDRSDKYSSGRSRDKDDRKDDRRSRKEKSDVDLRLRIDKAKLRKIAMANALQSMKSGSGPEVSIAARSGGKSVEELTNFCKKISEKERRDSDISDSEEEEIMEVQEDDSLIHHPFKLKENANNNIIMNIRNAKQLPVLTPTEKQAQQAQLRLTFPVSSGSTHRQTESEWVPVEPNPPTPIETFPAPSTSASKKHSITSEWKTALGKIITTSNKDKVKAIAAPPAPPVAEPPKPKSIFPSQEETKNMDIGAIISERLQAVRKLQENPYDVQALTKMHSIQEKTKKWASSKVLPGQFLGSTGAHVMSQQEIIGDKRHQAWAKKTQLTSAAPVQGGIGMFLLQKMGWSQGQGLGKNNEGEKLPLMLDIKVDRKGLKSTAEGNKGGHKNPPRPPQQRAKDLSGKHPVSALMELCNKRRWGAPDFQVVNETGPDHKKHFMFKVKVNNVEYQPAVASANKKLAKAQCAAVALQEMGLIPRDAPLNI